MTQGGESPSGARGRIDVRLRRVGATSHDAPAPGDETAPRRSVAAGGAER